VNIPEDSLFAALEMGRNDKFPRTTSGKFVLVASLILNSSFFPSVKNRILRQYKTGLEILISGIKVVIIIF
jgi:hypothetical protein